MSIILDGNGGVFADVDGTDFRAQKIMSKPVEYGVNGHYSIQTYQGNFAGGLAANSEIFQFQWAEPNLIAMINRIRFSATIAGTCGTSGSNTWYLYKATSWTAIGTGGVNANIPIGQNSLRTSMGSTKTGVAGDSISTIRYGLTTALTAGTKTLETVPLGGITATYPSGGSGPGAAIIVPAGTVLFESNVANGAHPLILGFNEGFSIISATAPTNGAWACCIEVQWTELAPVPSQVGY